MFDWNLSSTGCWQSGFSSQLWISRNEKTNLEFKKSGWSLPALHISHIPLAKRALWLSFITKIMIKIAQNSPVQHKNTRNSLVILFFYFWYWPKGLKGVEHERLWSYSKFRGAFQFEGFYQKSILLLNFAKKFRFKNYWPSKSGMFEPLTSPVHRRGQFHDPRTVWTGHMVENWMALEST